MPDRTRKRQEAGQALESLLRAQDARRQEEERERMRATAQRARQVVHDAWRGLERVRGQQLAEEERYQAKRRAASRRDRAGVPPAAAVSPEENRRRRAEMAADLASLIPHEFRARGRESTPPVLFTPAVQQRIREQRQQTAALRLGPAMALRDEVRG